MTQNTEIQAINNRKSVSETSNTTLKLTNMDLIFSTGYSHYKDDIIEILQNFTSQGTLIGNANRNTVKYFSVKDIKINFKSFKQPNSFNRIVYKHFRKSKARRSFEYANVLLARNFNTPQPIAFLENFNFFGLTSSYYISEHLSDTFTLRDVLGNPDFKDREKIIKSYTWLMFELHESGIEFIDNSSANFLIRKTNETYTFFMVDLNRMNFHEELTLSKRLKNFSKLTNDIDIIKIISAEYGLLFGISGKYCYKVIIDAIFRQQFKSKLKKKLKFYKSFSLKL